MSRGAGPRGPLWVWPAAAAFVVATLVSHAAAATVAVGLVGARASHRASTPLVAAPSSPAPTPLTPSPTAAPPAQTAPAPPTPAPPTPAPAVPRKPLVMPASCVRKASPRTTATIPRGDRFGSSTRELGPGARLVRLYEVHGGGLRPLDGAGAVRPCDVALWRIVTTLATPQTLSFVDELLVFDADLRATSSVAGEVVPSSGFHSFRLALSLNGLTDPREIGFLVAHEIAHLLTLNAGEVVGPTAAGCSRVVILGDVCLRTDSVLRRYLQATWSKRISADWARTVGRAPRAKRHAAAEAFVKAHSGSFVTPYAGYSQAEDFAETFALWCAIDPKHPYRRHVTSSTHQGARAKVAWIQATSQLRAAYAAPCSRLRTLTVR